MVKICPACGKKNRIPEERLADIGRCGACKTEISPVREPIEADQETFEAIVAGARVPVLVDFWAEWCGPCRMAAPEVKKVAAEMAGRAIVLKLNTEEWPALAQRYNVMSIPNFIVFRRGQVLMQKPGLVDHRQMGDWLRQAL